MLKSGFKLPESYPKIFKGQ